MDLLHTLREGSRQCDYSRISVSLEMSYPGSEPSQAVSRGLPNVTVRAGSEKQDRRMALCCGLKWFTNLGEVQVTRCDVGGEHAACCGNGVQDHVSRGRVTVSALHGGVVE